MFSEAWILLFLVLVGIGLFTGQGIVTALGGMGFLVGGISWLWNRVSLDRVTYERSLSSRRLFIGEEVTLSVSITNRKPIPLGWLRVEDDIPDALELRDAKLTPTPRPKTQALVHSTSIAWYERVHWRYTLSSKQRGFYRIGPATLKSGDLFGLFTSDREDAHQDYILVYPRVVPLEELVLPPVRPLGEVRGGLRIFEDPTRPAGVRDYRPGDPLKRVDWKATARHQSLQVRVFEPTVTHTLVVVLNADTVANIWEGYISEYLERAVTAAASVASYAFDNHYTVGLFSNGTPLLAERPMNIPPAGDLNQLTLMLEALATAGPVTTGAMAEVLAQHAHRFPLGATLVLVTAILPEELEETIDYLVRYGYRLVVLYVGDEEPPQLPEKVALYELGHYFASQESKDGAGKK